MFGDYSETDLATGMDIDSPILNHSELGRPAPYPPWMWHNLKEREFTEFYGGSVIISPYLALHSSSSFEQLQAAKWTLDGNQNPA